MIAPVHVDEITNGLGVKSFEFFKELGMLFEGKRQKFIERAGCLVIECNEDDLIGSLRVHSASHAKIVETGFDHIEVDVHQYDRQQECSCDDQ